jgi:hypothetical protein
MVKILRGLFSKIYKYSDSMRSPFPLFMGDYFYAFKIPATTVPDKYTQFSIPSIGQSFYCQCWFFLLIYIDFYRFIVNNQAHCEPNIWMRRVNYFFFKNSIAGFSQLFSCKNGV